MGRGKGYVRQCRRGSVEANPLIDLEKQPTQVLLAELRRMSALNAQLLQYGRDGKGPATANDEDGLAWLIDEDGFPITDGNYVRAVAVDDRFLRYYQALKVELAKRPHVPNKKEAKALRQTRAKEQRTR